LSRGKGGGGKGRTVAFRWERKKEALSSFNSAGRENKETMQTKEGRGRGGMLFPRNPLGEKEEGEGRTFLRSRPREKGKGGARI